MQLKAFCINMIKLFLDLLAHAPEPGAGIHREVAQKLKHRQGMQGYPVRQVGRLRVAGEAGAAVDDHAARAADARPAAEVELEGGVLLLADLVERDEQGHAGGLLQRIGLHMRL